MHGDGGPRNASYFGCRRGWRFCGSGFCVGGRESKKRFVGIDMGMERMAGLVLSVFLSCSLEAWDCGRSLESVSFFY